MNIGILTATDPALRKLQTDDLSDAKTGRPESGVDEVVDVVAPVKARPTGNIAPSTKFASMRAALDARIAADISSGTLTEGDAAAVNTTLDDIDTPLDRSASADPFAQAAIPRQDPAKSGLYPTANTARQVAGAYLATIERGTLVDRLA